MEKFPIDLTPIDDETNTAVFKALEDYIKNGSKPPADSKTVQLFILALLKDVYTATYVNRNHIRRVQLALYGLAGLVFLYGALFIVTHPSELLELISKIP